MKSSDRPKPAASLPAVFAGTSLFLLYQYVLAILRLNDSSSKMDNKFSAIARDEFLGFLISQNLLMLLAYLILAIIGAILFQPFVSWIARRLRFTKAWPVIVVSIAIAWLVNEYFTIRLVDTRPYFLQDTSSGGWLFYLLEKIPAAIKSQTNDIIFRVLPAVLITAALLWQIHRQRLRGYIFTAVILLLCAGFYGYGYFKEATATQQAKSLGSPNIIIIGSDSLRGDRLGIAGYKPARNDGLAAAGVSPVIDSLAKTSINFQNCYAPIGSTLESSTSFMTSQYPQTHGIRHMFADEKTLAAAQATGVPIAKLLREKGYDTAAIGDWCAGFYELMPLGFEHISVSSFDNFKIYMSQAVVMAHFVVPLYFDNPVGYKIFPQLNSFAQFVTPEVVTQRVEKRLAKVGENKRPFFWHVFYSCTHLPYRSTEPYASMFTDPNYSGPNKTAVAFDIDAFTSSKNLEEKMRQASPADIAQINALYDGCTRQFDDCVGRILEALKKNGLSENTIIIVTGDHGDDLYEPGVTLLHGQGFNGGLQASHVPMIVHVPGATPKAIPETVRLIDVMPTLADFVGIEKPSVWEGKSFAGWINGTETPEWRPFYGETGFPFMQTAVAGIERPKLMPMDEMTFIDPKFNYQFVLKSEYNESLIAAKQRCLATRNWKLVCTPTADGSRHFGLFHLANDPHGRTDLAKERPEILAPLQSALTRWIDTKYESSIAEIFPAGEPE